MANDDIDVECHAGFCGDQSTKHRKTDIDDAPLATHSNWQIWPHLRWSFQNIDRILSTSVISRSPKSDGPGEVRSVLEFRSASEPQKLDLSHIPLPQWTGAGNALKYLDSVHTDAFVVVHKGTILCEQYFGEQTADRPHIVQSISKTLAALTAACSFDTLSRKDEKISEQLLPELRGTGYEGATLRDLLEMTCETNFSEEYADPDSPSGGNDMAGLCIAMGWHPCPSGQPPTTRDFLRGLRQRRGQKHGKCFTYQSATSECLCWAIEAAAGGRAPGRQFEELLSKHIWSKLGQEHDAYSTVDAMGVCGVSGGICCTARDLARVGQMLVDNGKNLNGDQVVPEAFLKDCLTFDADAYGRYSSEDPYGQCYKNCFWIFGKEPDDASFMGYGIHGQVLWAHPREELVVVKMASSKDPMNDFEYACTMEVLLAIRRFVTDNRQG